MANKKITDLPSLSGATSVSADLVPIVDVSADVTSSITRGEFFVNVPAISVTGAATITGLFSSANVAITGGTITGITDLAVADGGTGASTAAGARTNLGLGTIATQDASAVAITGGTINATSIGATTRAAVNATALDANGNTILGTSSTNTVTSNAIVGVSAAPVTGKGSLQVGTIGYTDTGIIAGLSSAITGSYSQMILQNTNSAAGASTNFNVSNNAGTATTNFGEFGINSSAFGGSGSFGANGAVYLASGSTDLAIGTYSVSAIHFVVNNSATDAMTISGTGVISGTGITNLFASPPAIGATAASTARFTSLVTNGDVYVNQPAQTSKSAAATLTIAELLTDIIQYTGALATLTLPTGTLIEGGVITSLPVDGAFDFSVINTGTGVATLGTATGLTLVGSMAVVNATSGRFRVRKTATNTYTVYRIS